MKFNIKKIAEVALPLAAMGLTLLSGLVNNKNQEMQMNKAIEEKVAEALVNRAKEL